MSSEAAITTQAINHILVSLAELVLDQERHVDLTVRQRNLKVSRFFLVQLTKLLKNKHFFLAFTSSSKGSDAEKLLLLANLCGQILCKFSAKDTIKESQLFFASFQSCVEASLLR